MSLPPSGTILVRKANQNNDWMEEFLDASDIPINTSGSPWIDANVTSTFLEEAISELATELNTKASQVTSGSAFNFTGTTSDNTETVLDSLTISDGVSLKFTYDISAWNGTDDKFYGAKIDGVVYRDGSGATLVDNNVVRLEFGESTGYLARAITSGNDLQFTVSGLTGETINWRGKVNFTSDNIVEESLVFEGTRQNNTTPITFRNAADTQNIEVLNLSTTDTVQLESPSGIDIIGSSGNVRVLASGTGVLELGGEGTYTFQINDTEIKPTANNMYDIGNILFRIKATYSNSYLPFTGEHIYKMSSSGTTTIGDAVCLSPSYEIVACSTPQDPTCVGILAKDDFIVTDYAMKDSLGNTYTVSGTVLGSVAACGDVMTSTLKGMKVCNEGGNISIGDLLCSSSVPGHLMKQSVNSIKNFTIAKALQNVNFSSSTTASGVYGYLLL